MMGREGEEEMEVGGGGVVLMIRAAGRRKHDAIRVTKVQLKD